MEKSPKELQSQLSQITDFILAPKTDFLALKEGLENLSKLFLGASKLNLDAEITSEHIHLPTGKAIGLKWAAMCIEDMVRTKKFISGVHQAILDKLEVKKDGPVHVLYTGTGPFATLVMPLITKFSAQQVQFTCLEVNSISINSLKNVITALGAESYFQDIYQCDASQFKLPQPEKFDIAVIEVLQLALSREPQVAITYNLIPQLSEAVTLIPEEISLHIGGINTKKEQDHMFAADPLKKTDYLSKLAKVFTLNKKVVRSDIQNPNSLIFPKKELDFSAADLYDKSVLAILTEINVYKEFKLGLKESGLTLPSIFVDLNNEPNLAGISTQYIANNDPYLHIDLHRKSPH